MIIFHYSIFSAANSVASSGDMSLFNAFDWPSVDGVSAGRAVTVGALCRIICSKTSYESLPDSQLAQFYKVLYESLLEVGTILVKNCEFKISFASPKNTCNFVEGQAYLVLFNLLWLKYFSS